DGATTRDSIDGSSDYVDTKKLNGNIHAFQVSCKTCEGVHLTKECSLMKEDKAVEQSERVKAETKKGKEDMKEPVPRDSPVVHPYVPPKPFLKRFMEQKGNPYKTRETICMIGNPKKTHKAQEDEIDMEDARDEKKVVKEEEQDYNIPLHDGVMQPLTPQTMHITPPDEDYVTQANNPIFDMSLKEFGVELFDMSGDDEKVDGNYIEDTKELSIKTDVEFDTFFQKLLYRVSQLPKSSNKTASWYSLLLSLALDFKFSQPGDGIQSRIDSYLCGKNVAIYNNYGVTIRVTL
ncbi:hypothetical protein Tco_1138022, partial [Tanacetum coccineum]